MRKSFPLKYHQQIHNFCLISSSKDCKSALLASFAGQPIPRPCSLSGFGIIYPSAEDCFCRHMKMNVVNNLMSNTSCCQFRHDNRRTVVLEKIIVLDSQRKSNFFRNRQQICEGIVGKLVKFDPMLLWNHQGVAPAERLDVQKCITNIISIYSYKIMPFCSLYDFEGRDFAFDDTAENAGHVKAGYASC